MKTIAVLLIAALLAGCQGYTFGVAYAYKDSSVAFTVARDKSDGKTVKGLKK